MASTTTRSTGCDRRRIDVIAGLDRVRAFCDGKMVADHQGVWARHQPLTDPAHRAAAQALRRQRQAIVRPPAEPDVQIRCLADYDWAEGTGDNKYITKTIAATSWMSPQASNT